MNNPVSPDTIRMDKIAFNNVITLAWRRVMADDFQRDFERDLRTAMDQAEARETNRGGRPNLVNSFSSGSRCDCAACTRQG